MYAGRHIRIKDRSSSNSSEHVSDSINHKQILVYTAYI